MDLPRTNVLGVGVSAIDMQQVVDLLLDARAHGRTGYVCVTGVHGVIESQRDPELKRIHNHSLMTVPDGMPTVWMGREQGFTKMGRVYGPDLMLEVCRQTSALKPSLGTGHQELGRNSEERKALDDEYGQHLGGSNAQCPAPSAQRPFTHFLYGSTPETLSKLKSNLEARFPGVQIVGTYAPPFRPLNEEEEKELAAVVSACKPDFFWVGLSTPKQERFMAAHCPQGCVHHELQRTEVRGQTSDIKGPRLDQNSSDLRPPISDHCKFPLDAGIMLGVGAAFDIHAGLLKDAPEWVKNSGLQWLHRLCQEPRRLWRRYLDIVPKFIGLAFLQVMGIRKYSLDD